MKDATRIAFLGLRKMSIEKELQRAKVIVEACKIVEDHWDEFNQDLADDFRKLAREYDIEVEELETSLKKAEAEWLAEAEAYKAEQNK